MSDERIRRVRLDQARQPVALVHDGIFVYANPAFLRLLGYESFDELEAIPLLDTVVERHHERLRAHLSLAESVSKSSRVHPQVKLTLLNRNGSQLVAIMRSHRSQFEEETTIEFSLATQEDASIKNVIVSLPWKLYFSLLFLLIFTVLPSILLLELNINNAPKVYLPEEAPSVLVDAQIRENFPNDQVVLLLFEGVALYSDGFLEAFHALSLALESNPLIEEVISVTTQDHIGGTEEGFFVTPLIDISALEETTPSERRKRVLEDRFARQTLVSEDGSALSMIVIPATIDDSIKRMDLEQMILADVRNARLSGYLKAMAGQITEDVAQLRSMLWDNMIFIPATVFVGLLLIWWLFRRWIAVIVGGTVIGVVVSSTVAFYVLVDQPFNMISSIIPPLLSALTVAALVHLYNAIHHASKRGFEGKERVERALREVRRPALYTALTTAAGLASLGLSPIPPIKVFGLISSAGVMLIFILVIVLVPTIIARFDHASWPSQRGGMAGMDALVRWLFHLGIRYPIPVVVVTFVLLGSAMPQIWNLVVETNLQHFFHPSHEVRRSTDYVEQKLVGTTSLDVLFSTPQRGGLKTPENLKLIRNFQRWVEGLPEVDKSISPADFIEEMNWGFHAEKPEFRRIPENAKLISQYLFVYDGEDLFDFVDREYQVAHVSLNLNVHSANDISLVMDRIRDYLGRQVGAQMKWEIGGFGRMFADDEDLLVEGQVYSLLGALAVIFLLMLIQWRSWSSAALCMIPNLSPILLIFIVMGMTGIWLDMATAMIASVAVGIAVDDTIHVYHGFINRVKKGIRPVTALARTYRQAGRAVMTTTIILSAQFLVLITSQFVPTAHFGLLTTIGLVAALIFDLVLLPALLILIYGWRERPLKPARPST